LTELNLEVFGTYADVGCSAMSKPVFTKELRSTTVISHGVPYFIECAADGQPPPVIVWKKDDRLLDRFFNTTK